MNISQQICCLLLLVGLVILATGCATVPETGRRQFLLVGSNMEMELGLQEFDKLKQSTPVSTDKQQTAVIQQVGRRIAAVAALPEARWEFVLFEDPKTVNAFCLPGGKVGIYTGILPICQDENGLATVIAHEVAHAVARHGGERMSQALLSQLGGEILNTALEDTPAQTQNLWQGIYGLTSQVGWVLPHSRRQELEADHIGLLYMARAGYDPRTALDFWRRFAEYNQQHGGHGWEFLSTHPLDDKRITSLEKLMPSALKEYHPRSR